MSYYIVFGSEKRPVFGGGSYLDWDKPIGVYQADHPEDACKEAARDKGNFGTFFAIEGYPWGIELMQTSATQLGKDGGAVDRLEKRLGVLDKLIDRQLNRGDG